MTERPRHRPDRPLAVVVDDDSAARRLVRRWLEEDYEILEAATSHEALRILTERDDVLHVCTDSNMPEFDGIDLCRTIRSAHGDRISVVFVTASGDDKDMIARIRRAEGNAIVTKPFSGYALREALKRVESRMPPGRRADERRERAKRIFRGIRTASEKRLVSQEGAPVIEPERMLSPSEND